MLVPGHDGALLQIHVGQHHVLARDEAAADGIGKLVDGHVIPAVVRNLRGGFHAKEIVERNH